MISKPPESAMILAAGFGTRMRPLTETRPKALIEVAGRALIDRALDMAEGAGVRRAVVNLHYRGDQIREHLAERPAPEIVFSEEVPEILETGGGIELALPFLGDRPFFALNPDGVWTGPPPLKALAAAWEPGRMDALLLLVPRLRARGHGGRGDFFLRAQGGTPTRRGSAAAAPLIYTGAQILAPEAFDDAPGGAYSVNRIWDRLLAKKRLAAVLHGGGWVDVGTPEGLTLAEAALATAAP